MFAQLSIIAENFDPFWRFETRKEFLEFAYDLGIVLGYLTMAITLSLSVKGIPAFIWLFGVVVATMNITTLFYLDLHLTIWHTISLYFLGILLILTIRRYGTKKE